MATFMERFAFLQKVGSIRGGCYLVQHLTVEQRCSGKTQRQRVSLDVESCVIVSLVLACFANNMKIYLYLLLVMFQV